MARNSVQPRDRIFVKGYGVLSFTKNMGKNIGKNISKTLSDKYSQKLIDHTKQSATHASKTASKRAVQETAEGHLNDNKVADTITKRSRSSPQNNSAKVQNETENTES